MLLSTHFRLTTHVNFRYPTKRSKGSPTERSKGSKVGGNETTVGVKKNGMDGMGKKDGKDGKDKRDRKSGKIRKNGKHGTYGKKGRNLKNGKKGKGERGKKGGKGGKGGEPHILAFRAVSIAGGVRHSRVNFMCKFVPWVLKQGSQIALHVFSTWAAVCFGRVFKVMTSVFFSICVLYINKTRVCVCCACMYT